ncbi:MAG: hypothetical protein AAGH15_09570, partial [Myxococcota bacterium]
MNEEDETPYLRVTHPGAAPGAPALERHRMARPAAARRELDVVATLAAHAPSLLSLVRGDPTLPARALASPLEREEDAADFARRLARVGREVDDGPELHRALRRLRHEAVVRVALREVLRLADVDRTAADLAALAAAATDAALRSCRRAVEAARGPIVDGEGRPIPMTVLGMGKLGGLELNFGSDVDLIFFHGTDEGRVGDGDDTPAEAFARIARRTAKALGEVTRDGFVFRVDLRLRPAGSAGPLSMSLAGAERYYETFGRTWERGALMRASPIAGDRAFGGEMLAMLAPFIWRRQPDPSVAAAMHGMVLRSRRELRADPKGDVKLGVGGIRELEFFVQSLQLVWGGLHPALRVTGTMDALVRLHRLGFVSTAERDALTAAWALLRSVEHRVHMVAGYQTHAIPTGEAREGFARSLGFENARAFEAALGAHRAEVHRLFETLVEAPPERPEDPEGDALLHGLGRVREGDDDVDLEALAAGALPLHDAEEAAGHLRRLVRGAQSPFGVLGAARRPTLGGRLL